MNAKPPVKDRKQQVSEAADQLVTRLLEDETPEPEKDAKKPAEKKD